MKTRIISAIIAIPLLLFFIIYGGLPLRAVTTVLSLIGMYELYKAVSGKIKSVHLVGFILEIIYAVSIILVFDESCAENAVGGAMLLFPFLGAIFIIMMIVILTILVIDHRNTNINDASITVFGFFYVGAILSLICFIRDLGMFYVWLPFIYAFGSDTGAYFTGSLIGKHKLTPELSPKKTVEGSVGGVLTAVIITVIYSFLFNKFTGGNYSYIYCGAAVVGAILSQIGDLAASSIKRYTGIKDYGKLMPGHGGVLDRFDSVIFTAPAVFLVCIFELICK